MKGLLKSLAVVAVVIALAIVAVPDVDAAYTRDLTIGSSGSDVAELQTFLVSKGFLVMPVGVTPGYFGALTQAALARYQAANGIVPPAGYFGPLTRASVSSANAAAPVTSGESPASGVLVAQENTNNNQVGNLGGSSSSGGGGGGSSSTIKPIRISGTPVYDAEKNIFCRRSR
jgi:peptidoglycan hydrolase-like protein with peptidoglycan-binding domain